MPQQTPQVPEQSDRAEDARWDLPGRLRQDILSSWKRSLLAGLAHGALDDDGAVVDLGDFHLEEPDQQARVRAREHELRPLRVLVDVVEDRAEVDHGITRKVAACGSIFDTFFDRGNEIPRNRAAEDVVLKHHSASARQSLHANLAVAILTMAASLLLVSPLSFRSAGLSTWWLRSSWPAGPWAGSSVPS